MFRRLISIVFVMALFAVVFHNHAWAVMTTGTTDGVYDFGGLGANDSLGPGTGYARLGDKFKVVNDDFAAWYSVNDSSKVPRTAINTFYSDVSASPVVIKAEGGSTCKTFTFIDMGISFSDLSQKFGSFAIKFLDKDGLEIGSSITLKSGAVYSTTGITQISALSDMPAQLPVGVAVIEITYTLIENGSLASAYDLNLENITIANVEALPSAPSIFGVSPSSGPTAGGTEVTITGADFTGAAVTFGGINVIPASVSDSKIIATTPAVSTPSTVDIMINASSGITVGRDLFTFNNATGTADGTYDFGSLGVYDSAELGYARLGDKFKVENGLFEEYRSINTGPYTAIYPASSTITSSFAPAVIIIKAEGGTTCNTFTFKDLGISAYAGSQKFELFDIVLKGIDGGQLYTKSLGSSNVFNTDVVTNIRDLYSSQGPWPVEGVADVASIEITYSISASGISAKAWDLNLENITVANVVGKSNQSITFDPIPAISIGTAGTLSATATSGLPVVFTSNTTGVCTISDSTVTVLTAGSCIITANQVGNDYYLAAPLVTLTYDFSKGSQTITFGGAPSLMYNGGTGSVSVVASGASGRPVTFTSLKPEVCTVVDNTSTVTPVSAGSCIIAANQDGSAGYNAAPQVTQEINIVKASQTIDFNPSGTTYGDAPIILSATAGLPVSFIFVSGPATLDTKTNTLYITGAGDVKVKATQAGNNNYYSAATVEKTITIAPKAITITANNTSRAFSAANPADPGFAAPALVGTDVISNVTYSYSLTADAAAAVGTTHDITPGDAVFGAGLASNYAITYTTGTLTITGTASQTVTFTPAATATYGDAPINLTASASTLLPVTFSLVSGPAALNDITNTLTIKGAGSIIVKATQAGNNNYSAATVEKTITIAPKAITITANNTSRAYSAANPPNPGFAVPTLVGTDTISSVTYTYAGTADATAAVGTIYGITPGDAVFSAGLASNYAITYTSGTLTITGTASQTIRFSPAAIATYGDAPINLTASASTLLPVRFSLVRGPAELDDITNTLTIKGAGSIIVKATQAGDNNYSAATVEKTITIAPKAITITANSTNRAYSAANPPNPGFAPPALVGTDTISSVTYTYAGTADATAAVGTTHDITPSAVVLGVGLASNYTITYTTGTLTVVGTAGQSIVFILPATATYGDSVMTLAASASSGLPVNFTLVSGPATLASNNLAIIGAGSVVVKATQAGNGNYSAASDIEKTITVAKATPTITWTNPTDITYGTALSATQLNATASVAGIFTYTPAIGTVMNPGTAQTLSVSFVPADTANYNTPVTASAAIKVIRVAINLNDARNAYLVALGLNSQPTGTDLARYDLAPLDANGKPKGNGTVDIGDVVLMLRNLVGLANW